MRSEDAGPPAGGGSVFAADEEVGPDLARVDWSATPIGPPSGWSQSLQTAVSILLSSRFSMWLAWGPDLTFFCNAAYRRDTLGRKYPWALGRPAREVWAEIWDDIGPRIDTVLATGTATWDEALLLILERSGYPEETYHTFSYSPLRDDDGRVVGMLCVVTEETGRVIGERRMAVLRDLGSDPSVIQTERQVLAFAGRQLGRDLRDLPFTLTYLFDGGRAVLAASTGIAPGGPASPPVLLIGDPTAVWPVGAAAEGVAALVELQGTRFAGLPSGVWPDPPARALVVPLRQLGSTPYGFLVAALNRYRDLDAGYRGFLELVAGHLSAGIASARSYQDQQRRAEELAELDRAKTAFFSNISHEFRTPLTLILGPVQDLRAWESGVDERAREELAVVHRNGLRLNKLVNALLDFSRIEAGRMQARFEPTDLAAVTAELASVFRSAVEKAGLRFVVDCPAQAEAVYLDHGMWEKVVFNLLGNALKFTFDGAITLTVGRDDTHAVVTLADTGVGVPAAEIPRLFERFHRIANTRARSDEGSGIGLALVRELVELHGGTVTAESAEGTGTTFTIRLPLGSAHLPADALAQAGTGVAVSPSADQYVQEALRWLPGETAGSDAPLTRADQAAPSGPARVLIADDNADMREYLARLLTSAGYRTSTATDGLEALDAVRADPPDLLVSDVMMPGLDGLALLAALRHDPRTAAVPVVLLSARAGEEASVEGLRAGADDYLVKPFTAAELLARAGATVEMARLRTHHARWRSALVESLQEAFFVCDEHGSVIEINSTFTDVLGYGPEGLPYEPVHPWWPDATTDAEAHRQAADALVTLLERPRGTHKIPVTHRDGHRLWVTATFTQVHDPDTGRRVTVGTFRDATAEHYAVQRQAALSALNQQLAQADTVTEALTAAVAELRRVWRAHRVLAVTNPATDGEPAVVCAGVPARWRDLDPLVRRAITAVGDGDLLTVLAGPAGSAGVSLQHPDGVLVVWVELAERRLFTTEEQTLLAVLAGRLGQGLARVHQLGQQRETALALQLAILGPPQLPGGFAVRYQPATRPLHVGGDWYDAVELDGGRIALVVGDCVGHGLAAATVMGQLRSACRALLLENPSPAAALTGLDRFADRLPGAACTTAFCAVLDPGAGELVYSSAGHPPPILVHADDTVELLEGGRAIPLGIRTDHTRSEARGVLPPRATLLLYTDGLVERRRLPLDEGIGRAAGLVGESRDLPLEDLAGRLMTGLAPAAGFEDDVALLLYRRPGPLELEYRADVEHLAPARWALRGWLEQCGLDPEQAQDVLVAAGEALANAIEHGHRDSPDGLVRLRATATVDRVEVIVTDTGTWKPPRASNRSPRGRGLALMRALLEEVSVDPGPAGTTVRLRTRIAHDEPAHP
ncbi:SpoIIE family protein phosphatase [Amycolatopsis sp. NPDC051903]|uniref:SpoIIE family protein phosphatase n=1 Tax=Amycolatopsis sp. NPDC051903 TaxID=3363936 RepID=UPI0037BA3A3B